MAIKHRAASAVRGFRPFLLQFLSVDKNVPVKALHFIAGPLHLKIPPINSPALLSQHKLLV